MDRLAKMPPNELIGLILFIALLIVVALWAIASCWSAFKKFKRQNYSFLAETPGILAGVILAGCGIYGFFIEPYSLETHTLVRGISKLDKDHRNERRIRVVHISDLHCESAPRVESKLPATIKRYKPDIIVFSGDCVNCMEGLPTFRKCMKELSAIAPTYAARGNHDTRQFGSIDLFSGTGTIELKGQIERLSIRGIPVCVSGVPVDNEQLGLESLKKLADKELNIYVYHYPAAAPSLLKYNIDLMCAGHTHGGQVCLPYYGAIVTSSPTGKTYEGGFYSFGDKELSVNRGIGLEGSFAPRVRFLCPPQISVIDLQSNLSVARCYSARNTHCETAY